jgi:hypothetical protein
MISLSFVICHLSLSTSATAQTEPEYRLELGAGVGMVTYLGDFNSQLLKNPQPMFSLLAKYKPSPRSAIAASVGYGTLKGSSANEPTYYPDVKDYSFKTNIVDVGVRMEYNFWPFGTGQEYRGAQRLTPYILIGIGAVIAKPDKTEVGISVPIGGGIKYKAGQRWNMALEWAMHFSGNDRLDGKEDPYGIKRSGLFKNTDCYSQLRLSLTYDLWAKCKVCHNDRD